MPQSHGHENEGASFSEQENEPYTFSRGKEEKGTFFFLLLTHCETSNESASKVKLRDINVLAPLNGHVYGQLAPRIIPEKERWGCEAKKPTSHLAQHCCSGEGKKHEVAFSSRN